MSLDIIPKPDESTALAFPQHRETSLVPQQVTNFMQKSPWASAIGLAASMSEFVHLVNVGDNALAMAAAVFSIAFTASATWRGLRIMNPKAYD